MTPIWPLERVARLRSLAEQGLSSTAIGIWLGCSKNAVVGKCHRLDIELLHTNFGGGSSGPRIPLAGRPLVVRHDPVVDGATLPPLASARKTPKPEQAPKVPTPPVQPLLPRYGKGAVCQWPIGEPGTRGFRFCEKPAVSGRPYCAECSRLAYQRRPNWSAEAMPEPVV